MQIVAFSSNTTSLGLKSASMDLRLAYLIANTVMICGEVGQSVFKFENTDSIPFLKKVTIVEKQLYKSNLVQYKSFKTSYLNFISTKNKTTAYIAAYKKGEKVILDTFKIIMDNCKKVIADSGYQQLKEIIMTPQVSGYYLKKEYKKFEDGIFIDQNNFLELDIFSPDAPKVLMLGDAFFTMPFFDKNIIREAPDKNAPDLDSNFYLHKIAEIPTLSYLNASELMVARRSIRIMAEMFHQTMDTWLKWCYQPKPSNERKDFLEKHLIPAAKDLGNAINRQENIAHQSIYTNMESTMEVFIGEVPFLYLVEYYSHFGIMEKEVIDTIKDSSQWQLYQNVSWPVIVYTCNDINKLSMPAAIVEIFAVKKSIQID